MNIIIPDVVVATEREHGGAIVNSATKEELALDASEMRLWKALTSTGDVNAAAGLMLEQFGIDEETFIDDLNAFLSRAVPRGLVRIDGDRRGAWAPGPLKGTRFAKWIGKTALDLRNGLGWWLDARFDRRFGTDTTGRVSVEKMGLEGAVARDAVYYEATPVRVFRRALESAVPDPAKYVFVDYGSGKGRALLLASDFPFKRVIGVELSGMLHVTAQHNIRAYRKGRHRCPDVTSVCCDASRFELPDEDLVLYFYTPFQGHVFEKVLENIRASYARRPRRLILIAYSARRDHIRKIAAQPFVSQRREVPLRYEPTRTRRHRLFVFTNG